MRFMIFLTVLIIVSACSPADDRKATNDVKETLAHVGGALKSAVNSPSGNDLKGDVKDLAGDVGTALKKGAGELKEGAKDAKHMADEKAAEERREKR